MAKRQILNIMPKNFHCSNHFNLKKVAHTFVINKGITNYLIQNKFSRFNDNHRKYEKLVKAQEPVTYFINRYNALHAEVRDIVNTLNKQDHLKILKNTPISDFYRLLSDNQTTVQPISICVRLDLVVESLKEQQKRCSVVNKILGKVFNVGYYATLNRVIDVLHYHQYYLRQYKKSGSSYREVIDLANSQNNNQNYLNRYGLPTSNQQRFKPRAKYDVKSNNKVRHHINAANDGYGHTGAMAEMIKSINNAQHMILLNFWRFEPDYFYPTKQASEQLLGNKSNGEPYRLSELLIEKCYQNPNLQVAIMAWRNKSKELKSKLLDASQRLGYGRQLPNNLQAQLTDGCDKLHSRHQKFMVVDNPFVQKTKKQVGVKSFLGGMDLCPGRFDWQQHPVSDTEQEPDKTKVFHDNGFYDGMLLNNQKDILPPRDGWHEITSEIEGELSKDIIEEFRSQWHKLVKNGNQSSNCQLDRAMDSMKECAHITSEDDRPNFECQLTGSGSKSLYSKFFSQSKDKSAHKAYLQAINHANDFIFIENQYLTTYDTPSSENTHNKIPSALVDKIVEKANNNKNFHVYMVLPMKPDKIAHTISYLQWKTMKWMINEIERRTNKDYTNYISFYCYGQWHGTNNDKLEKINNHKHHTWADLAHANQRNQIYLHNKTMIVDDNIMINGSTNLTERSMKGDRDTELNILQMPTPGQEQKCQEKIYQTRYELWKNYFGERCVNGLQNPRNPNTPEDIGNILQHAESNHYRFVRNDTSEEDVGNIIAWPIGKQMSNPEQFAKIPDAPQSNDPTYDWCPETPSFLSKMIPGVVS